VTEAALLVPAWTFVAIVSFSATLGAMIAALFEAVRLRPAIVLVTTTTPALLAFLLVQEPVPLSFAVWTIALVAVLSGLSAMDAVTRTVPDLLSVPLILLGVIHAQANGASGLLFGAAALCVIGLGLAASALFRGRTAWLGGGDVLLVAGAVAWFGPTLLPDILLLAGVLLFARACLARIVNFGPLACVPVAGPVDRGLPLAPSLAAAQILVWMGGPPL
jgi:prepilin signal peptidase PulO-like enzyme (type II secretory pathway)